MLIVDDLKKDSKGLYKVTLSNKETYKFSEDVVVNYRLVKGKEISLDILNKAINDENLAKWYNKAVDDDLGTKEYVNNNYKENYSVAWDNEARRLEIMEYTDSGRVKTIRFGNKEISGIEARSILGLKSTKFTIEIGENIVFNVLRIWAWSWNESDWCR